uniref:Chitobiosyldiphosphodolichol beta-mannosyltransferase n=1 Tax=Schistocephalus solidus TaxID=70667 RepID=A0A0X3PHT3_SCHSO
MSELRRPRIHILVLGDVARSPRMRNHANSFVESNWDVNFSGYGSNPPPPASNDNKIAFFYIREPPKWFDRLLPRIIALLLKLIFLSISLFLHLVRNFNGHMLLVQSPPAAPTMIIVWFYALLKGVPVLVDWHNYGYTILEASSGKKTLTSKLYKLLEVNFAGSFLNANGRVKSQHFCVSQALQRDLNERTGIKSSVVYDLPTVEFQPTTPERAHILFKKLGQMYPALDVSDIPDQTIFTERNKSGNISWRVDRPALLVSSCSWTPDDDYSMMLEALDIYDATVASSPNIAYHRLFCIITGRGPLKEHFAGIIAKRNWKHVVVLLPWLDWSDYPVLLGCADLGVSLHRSTSGLDLPMKVVDFFGAGVPVLALAYPTLPELLSDKVVGRHFSTVDELATQLTSLLMPKEDFEGPAESQELGRYRSNLHRRRQSGRQDWHAQWQRIVLPVCRGLLPERPRKTT